MVDWLIWLPIWVFSGLPMITFGKWLLKRIFKKMSSEKGNEKKDGSKWFWFISAAKFTTTVLVGSILILWGLSDIWMFIVLTIWGTIWTLIEVLGGGYGPLDMIKDIINAVKKRYSRDN